MRDGGWRFVGMGHVWMRDGGWRFVGMGHVWMRDGGWRFFGKFGTGECVRRLWVCGMGHVWMERKAGGFFGMGHVRMRDGGLWVCWNGTCEVCVTEAVGLLEWDMCGCVTEAGGLLEWDMCGCVTEAGGLLEWDMCGCVTEAGGLLEWECVDALTEGWSKYRRKDKIYRIKVFMFYGPRTNAEFMVHNGFVYPENENDAIEIKLGISKNDPLHNQKNELCNKLKVSINGPFYLYKEKCVNEELLAFLEINVMNLGAHYPKVKELSLVNCGLRTLDGITSFPNLKVLRLPGNEIQKVDNCIYLYQLQHLDVERNLIHDVKSLEWLALCPKLISIVLLINPLYFQVNDGKINFSDKDAIKCLPKLKYIDGRALDATAQKLKKFRKWLKPYIIKQEKENFSENFSRMSFDTNTEYSTTKTSVSSKESISDETFDLNSI
ncbi:Actin-histidine N-methyltransferase like protein [Argiope bruennichi]|uniref:Actin-histidine N-methyltransferase like protein n=1 Tax=Argiope bruennichi TaxID=94029 RepID=A0A8T0EV78_ARGBR|nr:Actin-histidine N-methyltransferase like protein [Argiope bruennichi]